MTTPPGRQFQLGSIKTLRWSLVLPVYQSSKLEIRRLPYCWVCAGPEMIFTLIACMSIGTIVYMRRAVRINLVRRSSSQRRRHPDCFRSRTRWCWDRSQWEVVPRWYLRSQTGNLSSKQTNWRLLVAWIKQTKKALSCWGERVSSAKKQSPSLCELSEESQIDGQERGKKLCGVEVDNFTKLNNLSLSADANN